MHVATDDPRAHAVSVELLPHAPIAAPEGATSTSWQSWGAIQPGTAAAAGLPQARGPLVLTASAAERLAIRGMTRTQTEQPSQSVAGAMVPAAGI